MQAPCEAPFACLQPRQLARHLTLNYHIIAVLEPSIQLNCAVKDSPQKQRGDLPWADTRAVSHIPAVRAREEAIANLLR
jgi:hypothetical protein